MPMTGQPILAARSMTLQIFSLMTSPSEPPKTVKSWLKTHDAAAVDRAVAGDDGVAPRPRLVHREVVRAVADVGVELLERARVEQLLDPLARGVLALRVLLLHRLLGGVVDRGVPQLLELLELLCVGLEGFLAHRAAQSMRRASASPSASPAGAGRRRRGRAPGPPGGGGLRARRSLRPAFSAPLRSLAVTARVPPGEREPQVAAARELRGARARGDAPLALDLERGGRLTSTRVSAGRARGRGDLDLHPRLAGLAARAIRALTAGGGRAADDRASARVSAAARRTGRRRRR